VVRLRAVVPVDGAASDVRTVRASRSPQPAAARRPRRRDRSAAHDATARPLLSPSVEAPESVARVHGAPTAGDDYYMSLRNLARYSGLSVRTLRVHIADPMHPLPHYRPGGGKVLVRRSEFDRWMASYRVESDEALDAIVRDVLRDTAA
jgi:excisionase family DNA binding protein